MSKHATANRTARRLLSKAEIGAKCRAATGSARRRALREITPRRGRKSIMTPTGGGAITPAPSFEGGTIDLSAPQDRISPMINETGPEIITAAESVTVALSPTTADVAKIIKGLSPAMRDAIGRGEHNTRCVPRVRTAVALMDRGLLTEMTNTATCYELTDLGKRVRDALCKS